MVQVTTPVNIQEWSKWLAGFIQIRTFKSGFRIGFNHSLTKPLSSAKNKMTSAGKHPEVITEYFHSKIQEGKIVGPVDPKEIAIHTSLFGIIPKHTAS